LADPGGSYHFLKFLESEFSAENFKFLQACRKLDNISEQTQWYDEAKDILANFVVEGSRNEINIEATLRASIVEEFRQSKRPHISIYVFADAMSKILSLMSKDSYGRFLQWAGQQQRK
jgi:regulator of G-protein signaling